MSVKQTHEDYDDLIETWQKCRDISDGERAIHKAGAKYLPKLAEEEDANYNARVKRTPFFNASYRTIAGLRGMMFRKPPTATVPASIQKFTEDINLAGATLTEFAIETAEEVLTVGRIGLLVDYPNATALEGATVAQVQAAGVRPFIQKYETESILNWKEKRINSVMTLTLVTLKEMAELPSSEFVTKTEARYRVLDLTEIGYRQRVFRINDKGEDEQVGGDVYPLMRNKPLPYIPFIFIADDCNEAEPDEPPLIDLFNMNLHHYQVSADYEHGCHISGLPTLFISGWQPNTVGGKTEKIYVGSPTANALPQPDARAYFVEVTSQFNALATNLSEKKAEMAILGARMLESQSRGVETAEAVGQHRKGEESLLAQLCVSVEKGITKALRIMSDWAGANGDVKYLINKDFLPYPMTAQDIAALVTAWQAGAISRNTMFENLQAGEIIAEGKTYEEEQGQIEEGAPAMASGNPADTGGAMGTEGGSLGEPNGGATGDTGKPMEGGMDFTGLAEAIGKAIAGLPAPQVTVEAAPVDMTGIVDAIKAIPAPVVNVQAAEPAAPVQVEVKDKSVEFKYDSAGKISGAIVKEN